MVSSRCLEEEQWLFVVQQPGQGAWLRDEPQSEHSQRLLVNLFPSRGWELNSVFQDSTQRADVVNYSVNLCPHIKHAHTGECTPSSAALYILHVCVTHFK